VIYKNILERGCPQIKLRRMRNACGIPKSPPHSLETLMYVIFNAFPLQRL